MKQGKPTWKPSVGQGSDLGGLVENGGYKGIMKPQIFI